MTLIKLYVILMEAYFSLAFPVMHSFTSSQDSNSRRALEEELAIRHGDIKCHLDK